MKNNLIINFLKIQFIRATAQVAAPTASVEAPKEEKESKKVNLFIYYYYFYIYLIN